jgi:hypothetical protein
MYLDVALSVLTHALCVLPARTVHLGVQNTCIRFQPRRHLVGTSSPDATLTLRLPGLRALRWVPM